MDYSTNALRFHEDGFVVVRALLDEDETAFYIDRLKVLAGDKERWTQADGINRNPELWPLIFNQRLLATVREVLGPGLRYLPHNDLHLGFSSFSWHRDNVNRDFGDGPDWDESAEPYRIARVGIYLQRFDQSQFKLGLVKGSHRPDTAISRELQRRLHRRTSTVANMFSGLSGMDLVGTDAEWVATAPGDCIIFDPRILHTGSKFHGVKYAMFVAYGIENSHFHNHWHYYLNLRTDLAYSNVDPKLAEQLATADLLANNPPTDLTIEGAWIPSPGFTYVAKRFK
jgi:hypothetical protein